MGMRRDGITSLKALLVVTLGGSVTNDTSGGAGSRDACNVNIMEAS